ncbi:MAG TPA: hypothetical protein VFV41_07880 [Streptosporangiaceae bacterium]|nr:hypothetical protein [Streptosporangiaceae bacterium]
MSDEIEQLLADAARAVREYEVTRACCADLSRRQDEVRAELDRLSARYQDEQKDAERLESLSLTRVLASLRGARDDALARERAEADAARYRVAEAQALLDAVRGKLGAALQRQARLARAPDAYAAVLAQKELHLRQSGDPRGRQLLGLADERGRLQAELTEIAEAQRAADTADEALSCVQERLGSASAWSTYDTFFGGGAISSAVKHSRLDEAAGAAARADQCLAVLRTELADVGGLALTAPQLEMSAGTRFVDVWFDNIFSDLAVNGRISQARRNVDSSLQVVGEVRSRLSERARQAQGRLAAIETERRDLLTR